MNGSTTRGRGPSLALFTVLISLIMAATAVAAPSQALRPAVVDAIAEEMQRAMTKLRLPNAPAPYYISYKLTEVEVRDVSSQLGAVIAERDRHFINLEARVRVGSPQLDNGNFIVPGENDIDAVAAIELPMEATPRLAKKRAWLVTDQAYKEALMQLRAKLDSRKSGAAVGRDVPSWTTQKAVVQTTPIDVSPLEPMARLREVANASSAAFRTEKGLRESRVAMTTYLERRWYLDSEGLNATDTRRAAGVVVVATGQAPDGQEVVQYAIRYGHTFSDLPDPAALAKNATQVAAQVRALAAAPAMTSYSGPVLFVGEGATGLIRHGLLPHLGGTPLPEGIGPQEAKLFGGALTDKLGLRIAALGLSVGDDPTAKVVDGQPVIGGYRIDDEGTEGQAVNVIVNGTLGSLLTSRTPARAGEVSNGHARRTTKGGAFHGSATNVSVRSSKGSAAAALKQKLIAAAKAEGLPYGLMIKQWDDAAITAAPEMTRRELIQIASNGDVTRPPPALLAYRVYPNGKEELVRGAQVTELPIRIFRELAGMGRTRTVTNFLTSDAPYLVQKLDSVDEGFVPSAGIENSVAAPDLLVPQLDVVYSPIGTRAQPALPMPQ